MTTGHDPYDAWMLDQEARATETRERNADLKGRALRAASAIFAESGPPETLNEVVTALAAAWLDGYTAGTVDALSIVGEKALAEKVTA